MHRIVRVGTLALCVIAAALAGARTAAEAEAPGIIPPAEDDLSHVGEAAIYRGEQLFDYIDGAAPMYLEYGFEEIVSQELLLRGRTYIFDAYRMADPLDAYGLWSVRRPADPNPIGAIPNSSFAAYQGMAALGPYLIEISAYESSDTTEAEMAELILSVAGAIPDTLRSADPTLALPLTDMPTTGRLESSLRIARGPVSLRSAFGSLANGPFFDVVQVVRREIAEPEFTRSDGEPRFWILANYRLPGESETSEPTTTLVLLVDPVPAGGDSRDELFERLLDTGRKAAPAAQLLALDGSWLSLDVDRALAAVRRGGNLALAVSSADPALFRAWLLNVAAGR